MEPVNPPPSTEHLIENLTDHIFDSAQWRQKRKLIAYACVTWFDVTLITLLLAPYWRGWGYPLTAFYSVILGLPIFYLVLIYVLNQQILKLSQKYEKTS